ncbi:MAG: hypothetical protein O7J95_21815 [Planctomycetota bacterium]|nr:hypothetical protein [Planctomycetota bacterium]
MPAYSVLAQVPRPAALDGAGNEVRGSAELKTNARGWHYDDDLRGIVFKVTGAEEPLRVEIRW